MAASGSCAVTVTVGTVTVAAGGCPGPGLRVDLLPSLVYGPDYGGRIMCHGPEQFQVDSWAVKFKLLTVTVGYLVLVSRVLLIVKRPCPGQFASEGCFSLTRPRAGSGSQFSGLRSGAGTARGSRAGESLKVWGRGSRGSSVAVTVAGAGPGGLGPAGRVTW